MAEKKLDKKPDKKPAGGASSEKRAIEIIIAEIIIIGGLLLGVGVVIIRWVNMGADGTLSFAESFKIFFAGLISSALVVSSFVSLLFIMGIIFAKFKLGQLKRKKQLDAKIKKAEERKIEKQEATENRKWKKVVEHVSSDNSSDWRLSILEADILLGELLTKMGYKGEGIGEQLKSIEKSDFTSLQSAWEAHKIRNSIAHEGAEFPLSQREAKRVIGLFEEVFREFYYI